MRVVLDTNIIVSALLFSGQAAKLHAAWIEGSLSLLFSEATLAEYRLVLGYSKFALTAEDVAFLLEDEILPFGEVHAAPPPAQSWIPEDPSDDKFISLALAASADFLVSGDTHVLGRRAELPCEVLSLREVMERMEG